MTLKEQTFVCVLFYVLFLKVCSKVCSFATLTFGLVEAVDRTNGQFQLFYSSLNQTKYQPNQTGKKTHTLFNKLLERTHK